MYIYVHYTAFNRLTTPRYIYIYYWLLASYDSWIPVTSQDHQGSMNIVDFLSKKREKMTNTNSPMGFKYLQVAHLSQWDNT